MLPSSGRLPSPSAAPAADTAFRVFAFAWALSVELGMVSRGMVTTPMRIVVSIAALVVMIFPGQPLVLACLAVAWCVHISVDNYSQVYVHHWLVTLGSWSILLAVAAGARRNVAAWREAVVNALHFAAPAIATIGLVAAGASKLNTGFLDPAVSCANTMYQWQRSVFPWSLMPSAPWTIVAAIVFTFGAELGGPLLVSNPRTRRVGFLMIAAFFFAIGTNAQARLYEFSGPFLALYCLLIDWTHLRARIPAALARIPRWAIVACLVVVVAGAMAGDHAGTLRSVKMIGARAVYVLALAVFVAAVLAPGAFPHRSLLPHITWLVPALALSHEMLAYVGLRTHRNFAMAANFMVNTEITDHVVVRSVPDLGVNRLAILKTSSDKELNLRGRGGLPLWVLEDRIARHRRLAVTYTYEGVDVTVTADEDHSRFARNPWAKLLDLMVQPLGPRPPGCGHKPPSR